MAVAHRLSSLSCTGKSNFDLVRRLEPRLLPASRTLPTREPARNDVTIYVEAADSPAGPWTTVATSTNGAVFTGPGYVNETDSSGGLKTVQVRDIVNMGDVPRRFMRIEVSH